MNILISILSILAGIAILFLIIAAIVKKDFQLRKEITVNKSAQQVFTYMKMIRNQEHYSVWVMKDPNIKIQYTGTDGTVGFKSAWQSEDKNVGIGEQQIIKLDEGKSMDVEIRFKKPFEATNYAHNELVSTGDSQTKLVQTFSGTSKYPMNVMNLFMEKLVGRDMQQNLVNLKNNVEKLLSNLGGKNLSFYSQHQTAVMKKFLKIIGIIIVLIIAFVLVAGLFVSKTYHLDKSITINAPKEKVWGHVSSLQSMYKWTPWLEADPNAKTSFEGTEGAIGSSFKWEGNSDVGSGTQTITKVDPAKRIDTHLHFIKPFEGEAEAYIVLEDAGNTTKVTWGFDNKYSYPMNVMQLFMNMDKMMGDQYNKGLSKLKSLAEAN